jgi:multidrug efflux pump subunit AcrA (membrane-fusion protein)
MKANLATVRGGLLKVGLPLASVVVMVLAVRSVAVSRPDEAVKGPPALPPRSPFAERVVGLGLIEPRSEAVEIAAPVPGLVIEVRVKVGQRVRAGEALFRLDDRQLQAELHTRRADQAAAQAQLDRLRRMPRKEEVPASEARLEDARIGLEDADQDYRRTLRAGFGVAEETRVRSRMANERARAHLRLAEAELALLKKGAWEEDLAVAAANLAKAEAAVRQVETELHRLVVRAPTDATVLQVQVHAGEYASAPPNRSLMVLGDVERMHVRVSIDEHEIPRFRPESAARALVVGHPELSYPLTFVRTEPYVIPKRSLSGDNRERVDTRVLLVIYSLAPPAGAPLFVGQQIHVYIDAVSPSPRTPGDATARR